MKSFTDFRQEALANPGVQAAYDALGDEFARARTLADFIASLPEAEQHAIQHAPERLMEDIEAIAERAERGEDISAHFPTTFVAKQRVNVDFPLALLRAIDAECARIGVTRQAWMTMVCAEAMR